MAARKPAAPTPTQHASLNEALLAVQADMPSFQKDKVNPHFGSAYLSLETLMPQVIEVLSAHGLLLSQLPTVVAGFTVPALTTRVTHVLTGESVESTIPLSSGKETPQGQGAALTYLRRYMLTCLLGITVEKDDDGNRAQPGAIVAQVGGSAPVSQNADVAFPGAL